MEKETKKIIALMSGTSCDSIDAGLCEVYPDLSCKLIKGINHPYPEHIRAKIFSAFRGDISLKELCQLNFAIGKCFADAANILIGEFGKPDLISSHGQTVYHYPFDEKLDNISLKSTLQIGESSIIARETGCMVVSNFREKDIAYGGQGAPLVCFADEKWFGGGKCNSAGMSDDKLSVNEGKCNSAGMSDDKLSVNGGKCNSASMFDDKLSVNGGKCNSASMFDDKLSVNGGGKCIRLESETTDSGAKNFAIQNIGGISNVTVVSDKCDTFGFDTGCGNIMIDYCTQKFFGQKYDKDGEIANSGNICESWLNCLLQDEYYFLAPPKTTGREYFSSKYIENILKTAPSEPKDIIATLTALTTKTIAQAYERFIYPCTGIDTAVIGGGGAYNKTMMKMPRSYLPKHIELKTHEDFGISNNFKEVMAFALLGYCNFYNIPNNLPCCTGAEKRVVLGKITTP